MNVVHFDRNLDQALKWVILETQPWRWSSNILHDALKLGDMTSQEIQDRYRLDDFMLREKFTQQFGWSIPCAEAVAAIKKWAGGKPIYDVMAGSGYWAKILRDHGMQVIASDIGPEGKYTFTTSHVDVGELEARRASGEAHRGKPINLFVSWPPYECPITHKLLAQLPVGSILFFIGENWGGCTGSEEMFAELGRNFNEVESVGLPQWRGIHDYLIIYKKVSTDPIPEAITNVVVVHNPASISDLKNDIKTAEEHFRGKVEVIIKPNMIILRGGPSLGDKLRNRALYISNGEEKETAIHPTLLRLKPTFVTDWWGIEDDIYDADEFESFIRQRGWLYDKDEWTDN